MVETKLYFACAAAFNDVFKPSIPEDTGNMKKNASFFERVGSHEIEVGVNGNIAPYMVYTNEPWISPRWKGKQNPNEGWFDVAARSFADELAKRLGGTVEILEGEEKTWETK